MALLSRTGLFSLTSVLALFALACSDSGGSGSSGAAATAASNRARFSYDCNVQGLTGNLVLDVEAINTAGVVFGGGPSPDITGVIGTGGVLYLTAGELVTPTTRYVFTGDNDFADFTNTTTPERFRVQWVANGRDLTIVANPFGPGPTQTPCTLTGSRYL